MSETIKIQFDDKGIYRLGLNINEQNSFALGDFAALSQILKELAAEPKLRVLILHSLKSDVFSQGLNLAEMASADENTTKQFIEFFYENLRSLYFFPHPVLCAMPGHAMGYGCMLALVSDYRFMSEKARIGLPEVKLGIRVPGFIARIFQDLVGVPAAEHHILEGGAYKAPEAKELGLIDEIVEPGTMLEFAEKYAQKFLKNSRSAMTASKAAMRQRMDVDAIIRSDFDETIKALHTPDAIEGIKAAVEMRRPKFQG